MFLGVLFSFVVVLCCYCCGGNWSDRPDSNRHYRGCNPRHILFATVALYQPYGEPLLVSVSLERHLLAGKLIIKERVVIHYSISRISIYTHVNTNFRLFTQIYVSR